MIWKDSKWVSVYLINQLKSFKIIWSNLSHEATKLALFYKCNAAQKCTVLFLSVSNTDVGDVVLQSPSKNPSKVSLTVNRTKKRKVIFFFFFYIFNMAVLDWPNKVEVELQSWQFSPGNQYWTPYWRLLMHGQKTKGSSFPTERCLLLYPKLYIPSTLNIDLIFWHPQ